MFTTIPNGESVELVMALLADPSSWLMAADAGWSHPASREWILAADRYDRAIDLAGVKSPARFYTKRPWNRPPRRSKLSPAEALKKLKPGGTNG